nr:hypothetical protein [Ornithinimicrobium cavernae]
MTLPSSRVIARSTPGNVENVPARSTSAMLTRQSKSSAPEPGGWARSSRVTPPPFFQGTAGRSRHRRTAASSAMPPLCHQ